MRPVKQQSKDVNGNYFVDYVRSVPPKGTDSVVWGVAVTEYLTRAGVTHVTPHTTMANVDWPEIRRLHNRLLGEGKQRRNAESHVASSILNVTESKE